MIFNGQCNCGNVKFSFETHQGDIYWCHCSICRKATGANGIGVMVVDNDAFTWLEGESFINLWQKPGHDWQTWFCTTCGSKLPGHNDENRMFIPVGLIDEHHEVLKVSHHIWVDSKAHWDEIAGEGVLHPRHFGSA